MLHIARVICLLCDSKSRWDKGRQTQQIDHPKCQLVDDGEGHHMSTLTHCCLLKKCDKMLYQSSINNIPFIKFSIMRSRKVALTTQNESLQPKFSRLNKGKRLKTEVYQRNCDWFQSQKISINRTVNKKKGNGSRLSGQVMSLDEKIDKSQKVDDFNEWIKDYEADERSRLRKSQNQFDNFSAVKSHLDHVMKNQFKPSKPSKLHKRTVTQPTLLFCVSKRRRDRTAQVPMNRVSYSRCCQVIDKIYSKIDILREFGYTDAKIDEWAQIFCDTRKPFLKKILMRVSNINKYSLKELHIFQKDKKVLKNKIRLKTFKNMNMFAYIEESQLQQFDSYIEEILIHKNKIKVKEVETSIGEKLSLEMIGRMKGDALMFNKDETTQVANFAQDLQNYQYTFGPFKSFSRVNKLRFKELVRVQKQVKCIYRNIVEQQGNRIINARVQSQNPNIQIAYDNNSFQ